LADPDQASALPGGMTLFDADGVVLVEPQCCCDLANWTDWRDAAMYREADWEMLWVGHPWRSARFEDGWLIVSESHEGNGGIAEFRVRPADIERAVNVARSELRRFADELAAALAALGYAGDARAGGKTLAGLVAP
jgi:hypothetical protein